MTLFAKRLLLFQLALVLSSPLCLSARTGPVVQLASGSIQGIDSFRTQAFLGIPFAAPPVGDLRWASPAPQKPWRNMLDATHAAPSCAQSVSGDGPGSSNEDCLFLNLYRPSEAGPTSKLPVMVFFHGGGNISGTPAIYDGQRMAEVAHAIVVMPAYRLGVFGLLALPGLGPDAGTYLLQDQLAALRWVQANIGAFGGNALDVTLSGESSGAMDVCSILASPPAAGLYRQAILQSGFCLHGPSLPEAQMRANAIAKKLACTGPDAEVVACMRHKSVEEVLAADVVPLEALSGPAYGGQYLPISAESAVEKDGINNAPVLVGFNQDELWPFQHGLYPLSADKYQQVLTDRYRENAPDVDRLYPRNSYPHPEYALGAMAGDSFLICPALRDARELARFTKVSVYEFADRSAPPFKSLGVSLPRPPGYQPGAFHTAELQYLYNYQAAEGPLSFEQRQLGDLMIGMWVSFNRDTSVWPSFDPKRPNVLRLGADGKPTQLKMSVQEEHRCTLWDSLATGVSQ